MDRRSLFSSLFASLGLGACISAKENPCERAAHEYERAREACSQMNDYLEVTKFLEMMRDFSAKYDCAIMISRHKPLFVAANGMMLMNHSSMDAVIDIVDKEKGPAFGEPFG